MSDDLPRLTRELVGANDLGADGVLRHYVTATLRAAEVERRTRWATSQEEWGGVSLGSGRWFGAYLALWRLRGMTYVPFFASSEDRLPYGWIERDHFRDKGPYDAKSVHYVEVQVPLGAPAQDVIDEGAAIIRELLGRRPVGD